MRVLEVEVENFLKRRTVLPPPKVERRARFPEVGNWV
jgi:hypothetical protein